VQNVTPYNGSQLVDLIWQGIATCNFDLRPNASAGYGANSPSFTVLPTARAVSTTVGLPTATSTSTTTSSASSTPTATASNTGTAVPFTKSGLSSGAKAGIGVGVAIGVIGLLAAGIAFFFLRRRKSVDVPANTNPVPASHEEYYGYGQKYQPVDSNPGSYVQMQQMVGETVQKPSELSSDGAPGLAELSGGELRHEMSP
jgi:hypothetical protein